MEFNKIDDYCNRMFPNFNNNKSHFAENMIMIVLQFHLKLKELFCILDIYITTGDLIDVFCIGLNFLAALAFYILKLNSKVYEIKYILSDRLLQIKNVRN